MKPMEGITKKILIVDDEYYNIIGLKCIIEVSLQKILPPSYRKFANAIVEHFVDTANNGLEAVELVKKYEGYIDLIFMDCSMPILDGYEASDQIREYIRDNGLQQPQIIALTGHTEEEYIKKAWRHQIDEVISKPTNVNEISCLLKEVLILNEWSEHR